MMRARPWPFDDVIVAAASAYGLRPELLAAVIEHESSWDPAATGDGGRAIGLMQMHEAAAFDVGVVWSALASPMVAIFAGAAYLGKMMARFGRNERLALMAYNGGPHTVQIGPGAVFYDQASAYAGAVLLLSGLPTVAGDCAAKGASTRA